MYCSDKCRLKRCTVCNKVYLPKSTESYCNEECKMKKYTYKCIVCGEHFYKQVPSDLENYVNYIITSVA